MRIPSHGRVPFSSEDPHWALDRRIAEAVSPEKMKDNPHRGKPLRLDDNPFEGEWSAAFRLVRNAGQGLPWMDLQEDILQGLRRLAESIDAHVEWIQDRLDTLTTRGCTAGDKASVNRIHERFLERVTEQVGELRKKITNFNLMVPLPHLQMRNVRAEPYLEEIAARTAALLAAIQALPERPAPAPGSPSSGLVGRLVLAGIVLGGLMLLLAVLLTG